MHAQDESESGDSAQNSAQDSGSQEQQDYLDVSHTDELLLALRSLRAARIQFFNLRKQKAELKSRIERMGQGGEHLKSQNAPFTAQPPSTFTLTDHRHGGSIATCRDAGCRASQSHGAQNNSSTAAQSTHIRNSKAASQKLAPTGVRHHKQHTHLPRPFSSYRYHAAISYPSIAPHMLPEQDQDDSPYNMCTRACMQYQHNVCQPNNISPSEVCWFTQYPHSLPTCGSISGSEAGGCTAPEHTYQTPVHPERPSFYPDPEQLSKLFLRCGVNKRWPLQTVVTEAVELLLRKYRSCLPYDTWREICMHYMSVLEKNLPVDDAASETDTRASSPTHACVQAVTGSAVGHAHTEAKQPGSCAASHAYDVDYCRMGRHCWTAADAVVRAPAEHVEGMHMAWSLLPSGISAVNQVAHCVVDKLLHKPPPKEAPELRSLKDIELRMNAINSPVGVVLGVSYLMEPAATRRNMVDMLDPSCVNSITTLRSYMKVYRWLQITPQQKRQLASCWHSWCRRRAALSHKLSCAMHELRAHLHACATLVLRMGLVHRFATTSEGASAQGGEVASRGQDEHTAAEGILPEECSCPEHQVSHSCDSTATEWTPMWAPGLLFCCDRQVGAELPQHATETNSREEFVEGSIHECSSKVEDENESKAVEGNAEGCMLQPEARLFTAQLLAAVQEAGGGRIARGTGMSTSLLSANVDSAVDGARLQRVSPTAPDYRVQQGVVANSIQERVAPLSDIDSTRDGSNQGSTGTGADGETHREIGKVRFMGQSGGTTAKVQQALREIEDVHQSDALMHLELLWPFPELEQAQLTLVASATMELGLTTPFSCFLAQAVAHDLAREALFQPFVDFQVL